MSAPAKYLFDLDFGAGPKPANTVTLAEHSAKVAEAETRGYRAGFQAAQTEMTADTQRRLVVTLEQLAAAMGQMAHDLGAVENRLEDEAIDIACTIASKLAPELIAREPFAEITALVTDCLRNLTTTPHVVVRLSETLYPHARERLDELAQGCGFSGRLVILAESDIAEGDCKIEWADGGITRDRAAIEKTISEMIARFMAARRNASGQDPERSGQ